jgi:hypothetical protein
VPYSKRFLRFANAQHFVFLPGIERRAENEQMNPEQGMSKEEGRGMSEEMATKNAKNHKERYKPTSLRI